MIRGLKMYRYLFGPVPFRRRSISWGVDLVPHKTCSLDCIYCECGETNNLTIERQEEASETQVAIFVYLPCDM